MYVYLIGAGPGDPGLITCRGRQVLAEADVIVYDYLAGDELLRFARPGAELLYVGKKAGDHALPQAEINRLLVARAREGKVVARLKGGDPYVFGRGGEEAEELADAGIPFEEIPGVSSAVAGPACAGIPLTHRALASSVTLITGHEDPSKPGSVHNWDALAQSASTLVFVMGVKNLPDIARNLIRAGMSPRTPSAIIHWGSTDRQRSLDAALEALPSAALEAGFTSPSVVVVGEVVRLRSKLNWFEKRPLFGRCVVITRTREQAAASAGLFASLGARVLQFPTIAIRPLPDYPDLDAALKRLASYAFLVFTSANGVLFLAARMEALGLDARALAGLTVAAIGPATAEAVRANLGIRPDFVPSSFVAESVAQGLIGLGVRGARILLPRARKAREILPAELRGAGAEVDEIPVYDTVPPPPEKAEEFLREWEAGNIDCVTFSSSSTVRHFLEIIPPETLRRRPEVKLACIGPVTARTLQSYGLEPSILPDEYTVPAQARAVSGAFAGQDMEGSRFGS
jgi:uroporphyrinogen III methyltransferase/synthase